MLVDRSAYSYYGAGDSGARRGPQHPSHFRGAEAEALGLAGYGAGLAVGGRHPLDSRQQQLYTEAPALAPSIPVAAPMLKRAYF